MLSHQVPSPPLTALVTGASSGLGEAIARELSSRGPRLPALHVQTPTRLCPLFGRDMLARRRGWILNVASISALFPDPSSLTYGPCKRYLLALRREKPNRSGVSRALKSSTRRARG